MSNNETQVKVGDTIEINEVGARNTNLYAGTPVAAGDRFEVIEVNAGKFDSSETWALTNFEHPIFGPTAFEIGVEAAVVR